MAHERTVIALFANREDAQKAMARLVERGIPPERIGYLEPVDERELKNPAKGATEGIAVGATSGAVGGAILASVMVAMVPGIGPALVAGALLPAVLGAVAGSAGGGTVGGLLGTDLAGDDELFFMQEVQAGRILVSAEVERGEDETAKLLEESGALEVDRLGTAKLHARLRRLPEADTKGRS